MSTAIQWTDETWNPVVGCTQVSPGCDRCYAKTLHDMRHRAVLAGKKLAPQYAQPFEVVQLKPERLNQPLSWRKPRRVFVNSVSDLFHADVPDEYLDKVFSVMAQARRHTFQILTKRAGRMRTYTNRLAPQHTAMDGSGWPLPNVWLGVSVENKASLNRIYTLRETTAAVRFVSFEPLLEAVEPCLTGIDWAIIGGESGKDARSFHIDWARHLIGACRETGTAPFVKQLGAHPVEVEGLTDSDMSLDLRDSHGGDMSEWPEDLRVREYPLSSSRPEGRASSEETTNG